MYGDAVFGRIDIGRTALRNDEMLARRRDRAVEQMQGCARILHARLAFGIGQRAYDLFFEARRLFVGTRNRARHQAPCVVREHFGCCIAGGAIAAQRYSHCRTAAQKSAPIEQAVTSHWRETTLSYIFQAMSHAPLQEVLPAIFCATGLCS